MNFKESTLSIRAAVEVQSLSGLQAASKERDAAIAAFGALPPSSNLCEAVADSIAAGEEAKNALSLIKQRMRSESRRLADIEQGFLRTMRGEAAPHIDCKG